MKYFGYEIAQFESFNYSDHQAWYLKLISSVLIYSKVIIKPFDSLPRIFTPIITDFTMLSVGNIVILTSPIFRD